MATLIDPGADAPAEGLLDCRRVPTRRINGALRALGDGDHVTLVAPEARHSLAVGLEQRCQVIVDGDAGYYVGALCAGPEIVVRGHAGNGVGENLASGSIRIEGDVGSGLAASARGGIVAVRGSAGSRAAIALKGATVVVGGDVGAYSAFMMQLGTLIVLGEAGPHLGDSIYEGVVFVAGGIDSLGADATATPATEDETAFVLRTVAAVGLDAPGPALTRVTTKRELYEFDARTWRATS